MLKTKKKQEIKKSSMMKETWYRLKKSKLAIVGLCILIFVIVLAVFAPIIAPYGYDEQQPDKILITPSWEFWFGTDNFGRDILSRMIYGSRITLLVGAIAVTFSAVIGCTLGIVAGFFKKGDNIIMRCWNTISAFGYCNRCCIRKRTGKYGASREYVSDSGACKNSKGICFYC